MKITNMAPEPTNMQRLSSKKVFSVKKSQNKFIPYEGYKKNFEVKSSFSSKKQKNYDINSIFVNRVMYAMIPEW